MARERLSSHEHSGNREFHDVFLNEKHQERIAQLNFAIQGWNNPEQILKLVSDHSNINRMVSYSQMETLLGYTGMLPQSIANNIRINISTVRKKYFGNQNSPWSKFQLLSIKGSGVILTPRFNHELVQLPALEVENLDTLNDSPEWRKPYLALNQRFKKTSRSEYLCHLFYPNSLGNLNELLCATNSTHPYVKLHSADVHFMVSEASLSGVEIKVTNDYKGGYALEDLRMADAIL